MVTLGIIGIVAALTIPTLIADYRNDVTETRLKKFYSVMNQAILQSINENGEPSSWSYWVNDIYDEEGNLVNQTEKIDASFQKYLAPYLNIIAKKELKDYSGSKRILYYFSDGSAFAFVMHQNRDFIFFPKNAEKCLKKSTIISYGTCSFNFEFFPLDNSRGWKYNYNKGLEPVYYGWDGNENSLFEDSVRGCKNRGIYCTAIIQRNGWKVPDNYPRRISF